MDLSLFFVSLCVSLFVSQCVVQCERRQLRRFKVAASCNDDGKEQLLPVLCKEAVTQLSVLVYQVPTSAIVLL